MLRTRRFYFETWPPPARIKVKSSDKCVDMDAANGHNLYMHNCHTDDNQKFYLVDDSADNETDAGVDLTVPLTSGVMRAC